MWWWYICRNTSSATDFKLVVSWASLENWPAVITLQILRKHRLIGGFEPGSINVVSKHTTTVLSFLACLILTNSVKGKKILFRIHDLTTQLITIKFMHIRSQEYRKGHRLPSTRKKYCSQEILFLNSQDLH